MGFILDCVPGETKEIIPSVGTLKLHPPPSRPIFLYQAKTVEIPYAMRPERTTSLSS